MVTSGYLLELELELTQIYCLISETILVLNWEICEVGILSKVGAFWWICTSLLLVKQLNKGVCVCGWIKGVCVCNSRGGDMACMKLGSKTDAFQRKGQAWYPSFLLTIFNICFKPLIGGFNFAAHHLSPTQWG